MYTRTMIQKLQSTLELLLERNGRKGTRLSTRYWTTQINYPLHRFEFNLTCIDLTILNDNLECIGYIRSY